jgi:hypothetical protein
MGIMPLECAKKAPAFSGGSVNSGIKREVLDHFGEIMPTIVSPEAILP